MIAPADGAACAPSGDEEQSQNVQRRRCGCCRTSPPDRQGLVGPLRHCQRCGLRDARHHRRVRQPAARRPSCGSPSRWSSTASTVPAARAWAVSEHVPRIDGYTLDLIVDFVTCIVIPVHLPPPVRHAARRWSLYIGAFVLFMSALWMSRTDQMTHDHWFNGFPCEWNMIVPTLFLLDVNPWFTAAACVALGAHPADQLEVRPPDAGAAVPSAHGRRSPSVARDGAVDDCRVPARQARCRHRAADRLPAYIVGIGVWRTVGQGADRGCADRGHLSVCAGRA